MVEQKEITDQESLQKDKMIHFSDYFPVVDDKEKAC
jgi:hypothetical protein